ncbi:hypothetical protein PLANPX_2350 [Lacipirellula parvula]|uniref:Uncharacterized protein n=1 Tax=Lacipirellula parvula TaxID=2650471 RepID=A0A5K7X858_9BACT|nr:hypothetical protein PLANPX_2350 [Lacipirellula parvula]
MQRLAKPRETALLAPTFGRGILAASGPSPNGNSRPVAAGQRPAGAVMEGQLM